jgi:hypothetical protein
MHRELLAGNDCLEVDEWAGLMNANFKIRKSLYGDAALGSVNLDMIQSAVDVGAAAKFCGSGGAILVCCPGGQSQVTDLVGVTHD